AGIALASRPASARHFMLIGGALYLVLWVYGLAIDKESMANFVPLNSADDWLHFVLGVSMMGLSLLPRHRPPESTGRAHHRSTGAAAACAASVPRKRALNSPGQDPRPVCAVPVTDRASTRQVTWSHR